MATVTIPFSVVIAALVIHGVILIAFIVTLVFLAQGYPRRARRTAQRIQSENAPAAQ